MKIYPNLNKDSFLLFAAKVYDPNKCIQAEFEYDLKRFKHVRRFFQRYKEGEELKERLILNHIIILANVFGTENSVRMLFFRIPVKDYDLLKTFLLYLDYLPKDDWIYQIDEGNIKLSIIPINTEVVEILRKL